jgi:hypothetical protein
LGDGPKTFVAESTEPQLPAFRFGLKHLFWCVTGACLLLAALVTAAQVESMTPLFLLMAVLVVALHVCGTAIGTRLRAHANERRAWEAARSVGGGANDSSLAPLAASFLAAAEARPRSPLHVHDRPVRRMRLCVAAGAIVGGCLGVAALSLVVGGRSSVGGIVVGAMSMAVVGAWLAFVGASSWSIFRQGWRDAVKESREE